LKVTFSSQNNNSSKLQKQKIAFEAGLTPKMIEEIRNVDVLEISKRLEGKGIPNDFQGNKVLAWGSDKTVELFEQFNERFGTNISLPKAIFAINFKHLNTETPHAYGICNLTRTKLIKGSNEIIPSRIVFFNTEHNWDNINPIADARYAKGTIGTDFFLYPMIHEYTHVAHEDYLLSQFDGKTVAKKITSAKKPYKTFIYRMKYGDRISQICKNALIDPFETIACDMPIRLINSIDKETLKPIKNPFVGTPYEKGLISQEYSYRKRPLPEILGNIWNGKFD